MEREVFHYKTATNAFLVVFLAIWSGGWMVGVLSNPGMANARVNGRLATPNEALGMQVAFPLIGLVMATLDVLFLLWTLRCRVEFEAGEIRCFDFLNRRRFTGVVGQITVADRPRNGQPGLEISNAEGSFRVYGSITNYGRLKSLLQNVTHAADGAIVVAHSAYVPSPTTASWRWSSMHVFSFLWLGVNCCFFIALPYANNTSGAMTYVVLTLFLALGIGMQLVGWNARVSVGPDGIESIGWNGRVAVKAALDEIESVGCVRASNSTTYQVFTTRGTISINSQMNLSGRIVGEINKVLSHRPSLPPGGSSA